MPTGRIELDGELPEGASVTVIARDDEETFEADPASGVRTRTGRRLPRRFRLPLENPRLLHTS